MTRPIVFNQTIGWLREAVGGRGVVVAGSHGFEDLCSRRFLTLLADRIAQSGSPVLQFDYPGCGDAADDHSAPGQVANWIAGISAAIDELKRQTGVTEVIVIGFRLGALLSAQAVEGRGDVTGLVLLAPPVSGKAYVRELTALSRMVGASVPCMEVGEEPFDGRIVAGFRLSAETLADLSALSWEVTGESPSLPVLSMACTQPPELGKWADASPGNAREIVFDKFEGYGRLVCDPTANKIPLAVIERCAGWIHEKARGGRLAQPAPAVDRSPLLLGPEYEEEPVLIGPKPDICGVLCRPAGGREPREAIVFLNSGGVPHVGWARGTVESARMLAAEGIATLRIDLPGLGQSDAPDEERVFLYDARGSGDVSRAIDWMMQRGFDRVSVAGVCSGAFQAFHAARADRRVHRLVMINPLCFAWNSSYALDMSVWKAYETAKAIQGPPEEAEPRISRRDFYVAASKAGVSKKARLLIRRGLEAIKTTLANANPLALMQKKSVERWMRDLANNGVQILLVTSEGDLSHKEIDRHFGPDGARLRGIPNVSRLSLRDADHTLTPLHARRALVSRLIEHHNGPEPRATQSGWNAHPVASAPLGVVGR